MQIYKKPGQIVSDYHPLISGGFSVVLIFLIDFLDANVQSSILKELRISKHFIFSNFHGLCFFKFLFFLNQIKKLRETILKVPEEKSLIVWDNSMCDVSEKYFG